MASKDHQQKAANPADELRKQIDLAVSIGLRAARKWWLLLPAIPLAAVMFVFAPKFRPPVYQSEAVLVYQPVLRSDVALGAKELTESPRDRGKRYCEMLSSSSLLAKIIAEENLYAETRESLGMRDAVLEMREDSGCYSGEANTIRLSFFGEDPDAVFRTTGRLADSLIDIASREGFQQLQKTRSFLEAEERRSAAELREREQARAQFLQEHPEFAEDAETSRANNPVDRTTTLRRQAARLERLLAAPATSATPAPPQPEPKRELTPESQRDISAAEASLAEARGRLAQARQRFTPQHPDVLSAQNVVARAVTQLEQAKAKAQYVAPPEPSLAPSPPSTSAEDRTRMQAQLAQIRRSLQQASGDSQPSGSGVDSLASLEVRWSELNRELATVQERHEQFAGRLFRASLMEKAAEGGEGSPMAVVDPPYRPNRPSARGARRTGAMAAAALVFVWFVGVLGIAFLDDRLYTAGDAERLGLGGFVHAQRRGA